MNAHVRDDLDFLKSPPTDLYTFNDTADWTTTSTTFTDIDATDISLNTSTDFAGGDLLVVFHGVVRKTTNDGILAFDFTVDGTRHGGDDGIFAYEADATAASARDIPVSFARIIQSLAAGDHTIVMQWKTSTAGVTLFAGAGTASHDCHGQFWCREV